MSSFQRVHDTSSLFVFAPISREILDHTGLLTPVLNRLFGEIYVEVCEARESETSYWRQSIIRQKGTCQPLVYAELDIFKGNISTALLDKLRVTSQPFGQLLRAASHRVELGDQRFFMQPSKKNNRSHLGRSHSIYAAFSPATEALLVSRVTESLEEESNLERLRL